MSNEFEINSVDDCRDSHPAGAKATWPLVSVVIAVYNGEKVIDKCIEAVLKLDYPNIEIIVVDGGSTDGTWSMLRHYQEKCEVRIFRNRNRGVSADRNLGIIESVGAYVFLVDADVFVTPNALKSLVRTMENDPNAAVVEPKILWQNSNRIRAAGATIDRLGFAYGIGVNEPKDAYSSVRQLVNMDGAADLIRKDVITNVGLFDEYFFFFYEPSDLAFRIQLNGHKIVYCAEAIVYHSGGYARLKQGFSRNFRLNSLYHMSFVAKNFKTSLMLSAFPLAFFLRLLMAVLSEFLGVVDNPLEIFTPFWKILKDFPGVYSKGLISRGQKDYGTRWKQIQTSMSPLSDTVRALFLSQKSYRPKGNSKSLVGIVRSTIFSRIKHVKNPLMKPFAMLVLVSIAYVLLSYRGQGLTIGGDHIIPLHSTEYLEKLFNGWNLGVALSSPLPIGFSLPPMPDILLFSMFRLLSFDIYTANKLYVLVLVIASSASMYYLATTIFHENNHKHLLGVAAALAYLFNPWIIADTYKSMVFLELSLTQTGFALFLAYIAKFFSTRRMRYAVYSSAASFLMLSIPGIASYQLSFLAVAAYVLAILFCFVRKPRSFVIVRFSIVGSLITATLTFLVNAYWLLPFVGNINGYISFAAGFQTNTYFNQFSNVINNFRLMNAWGFYAGYAPYSDAYVRNPVTIALTFMWPLLAFAPLLFSGTRKNPKALVLCALTVLTVLLCVASGPPLGEIYVSFVNVRLGNLYPLKPFYTSGAISQHVLTIEYALLIALLLSTIYHKLTSLSQTALSFKARIRPSVAVSLLLVTLMVSSWPIVTGDVMRNWYSPDQYGVRIPDRYWEADEYLVKLGDQIHRTLLLPPTEIYVGTSWGYQGTSQFYNLMFNVPLVTGNEIPYGITSNQTSLKQVHSVYYTVPNAIETLDVTKELDEILTWQNDSAHLTSQSLLVHFNSTQKIGKWHQVELKLSSDHSWSDFTFMIVQFKARLDLDKLQIGAGDTGSHVGWWMAKEHSYKIDNGTFAPSSYVITTVQESDTTTLLLDLRRPDLSNYSVGSVASVWIQYFVTNSSDLAFMQIDKLLIADALPNTIYYAHLLAQHNIRYALIDLSIKDGAKSDPEFWRQMLSSSDSFRLIWQQDSLYIFENRMLQE